jgi:hypothetical protein
MRTGVRNTVLRERGRVYLMLPCSCLQTPPDSCFPSQLDYTSRKAIGIITSPALCLCQGRGALHYLALISQATTPLEDKVQGGSIGCCAHYSRGEAFVEAAAAVCAQNVCQAFAVGLPSQRHVRAQRLHRICHHCSSRPRHAPCHTHTLHLMDDAVALAIAVFWLCGTCACDEQTSGADCMAKHLFKAP